MKIKIDETYHCGELLLSFICTRSLKLRVHIKDKNNSPHGKILRFLFPFSSKFPDLNFAPYVLNTISCYMKPVRDTNSEPGSPVV